MAKVWDELVQVGEGGGAVWSTILDVLFVPRFDILFYNQSVIILKWDISPGTLKRKQPAENLASVA